MYKLDPDPATRSRAIATRHISPGDVVLKSSSLASVLLPEENGRRCDECLLSSSQTKLKRCTGCGSYWFCNPECQILAWKSHHRKICKNLSSFNSASASSRQRTDGLLTAHLISNHFSSEATHGLVPKSLGQLGVTSPEMDPVDALLSLVAHPGGSADHPVLPHVASRHQPSHELLLHLLTTITNNHWVITNGHLKAIGHGIFPVASRSFNHSCRPSAAPSYYYEDSDVIMEVRAIEQISIGEEITVSYLDPATPYHFRQQQLRESYGFQCLCKRCHADRAGLRLTSKPLAVRSSLEAQLLQTTLFTSSESPLSPRNIRLPPSSLSISDMPRELISLLDEDYLPDLSGRFSQLSHTGRYSQAIQLGLTLLGVYLWIYPRNYPLIGVHALEVAKVAWNSFISLDDDVNKINLEYTVDLVAAAREVLKASGPTEGKRLFDELGPWDELILLERLLRDEPMSTR